MWEPEPPGTLRVCPGIALDFTVILRSTTIAKKGEQP